MDILQQIKNGRISLGIEFGSTRVKAVAIGEDFSPLATGSYDWENKLENGIWTYSLASVHEALRGCYAALAEDMEKKYGARAEKYASMGVSAMMHGYLVFDENNGQLAQFRTWRNTMTEQAADELTEMFGYNIPQRWSIAHLWQAILGGEEHVGKIRFMTTLAGYVHWLLTGEKTIGIGDASGMFPIDSETQTYNAAMLEKFRKAAAQKGFSQDISSILPKITAAGECAGVLTESGAAMLDPTGTLKAGVPLCPPEGDAQTGMVATNSIAPRTGNVSAGTSVFAMAVLERELSSVHRQIDVVTTPCGLPVAMVHCNNCTTELNAWMDMFGEMLGMFGADVPAGVLYEKLFTSALSGSADCGGVVSCGYHSGEHVTGFSEGRPLVVRTPSADFSVPNFMRSLIYSCMATLKIGMDVLFEEEKISLEKIYAHGGLFKTPVVGQRFLAAALGTPVELLNSAGEGGAWGIALLAAYLARKENAETLEHFLADRVFSGMQGSCAAPEKTDVDGFASYISAYKAVLDVEKAAVERV